MLENILSILTAGAKNLKHLSNDHIIMEIKGFLKNSFVDWDGKIASVIFLPGCNFRCGFCYNVELVLHPKELKTIDFSEIQDHLQLNRGFIDGVVITGGEPTIHPDLPILARRIKEIDFPVKLDTNGSNPHMLRLLLDYKLVDYVAMDIKGPIEIYGEITGVEVDATKIKESINLIMSSGVDYEFRTTVIPPLHKENEIEKIAEEIKGAKKYALQKFVNSSPTLDPKFNEEKYPDDEYMKRMKKAAEKHLKNVIIRE